MVKRILRKAVIKLIKTSRMFGVKQYMKLYVSYLRKCGMNITEYDGDGFIAHNVYLDDSDYKLITIGKGVTIAAEVMLLTHDYSIRKALNAAGLNRENKNYRILKPITIGNNSFLGARSIVLPGTNIGENTIIAAGSIVKGTVPSNQVWGGVPARFICTIGELATKHYESKDYKE